MGPYSHIVSYDLPIPPNQESSSEEDEEIVPTMVSTSPAEYLMQQGTLIRYGKHSLVKIIADRTESAPDNRIKKWRVSVAKVHRDREEKVVILLGATGTGERMLIVDQLIQQRHIFIRAFFAGKSTLMNAFLNHFYGVNWTDPYRLVMLDDNELENLNIDNPTTCITAFTFPWQEGCLATYDLTIVDTPGFTHERGLRREERCNTFMEDIFAKIQEGSIHHVDGVGFVLQASKSALTTSEQAVFKSILDAFGNDVIKNVYLMITFADAPMMKMQVNMPPIVQAIHEENMPFQEYYPFNNPNHSSSIDATKSTNDHIDAMSWEMSRRSFSNFLSKFQESVPMKLQRRKVVVCFIYPSITRHIVMAHIY